MLLGWVFVPVYIHELWGLHDTRVSQGTIWGPENQNIPVFSITDFVYFYKNISKYKFENYALIILIIS